MDDSKSVELLLNPNRDFVLSKLEEEKHNEDVDVARIKTLNDSAAISKSQPAVLIELLDKKTQHEDGFSFSNQIDLNQVKGDQAKLAHSSYIPEFM